MDCIVWFRQDLRITDNPALNQAEKLSLRVIPVYIWSPDDYGEWKIGAASKWWLHRSLQALQDDLSECGLNLVLRTGAAAKVITQLLEETSAKAVFWNRCYEPLLVQRDMAIKAQLKERGIQVETFNARLLVEPWEIKNRQGKPYQVFTPFCKAMLPRIPDIGKQSKLEFKRLETAIASGKLEDLKLEPKIPWAKNFETIWSPGEKGACAALASFKKEAAAFYHTQRDIPEQSGTSKLSAHLHFGEISVQRIWHELAASTGQGFDIFKKQLIWREFAYHLLFNFPQICNEPLRNKFSKFPWTYNQQLLVAWQKGQTGYPIVDAGMRELWATGWMHNRVRMIVASFLVKHLMISWQFGAKWFWDTLVDADMANNSMGWQWCAGCGADAAPFFRIFNPILQGEKFDVQGLYVKRWVPELKRLSTKWVHKPFLAPSLELQKAGIELGKTYPLPVIDLERARTRALRAYSEI